ncbi:sigma-70 family RNA polymerase sigma factor [Bacillus sp. SD075]|uniref:sigma-70 family RNA polymerase sigma factor n=1 Tax=Bacillus sp. SD075 TaxID=2781732 RepID=UPI001A95F94D|nr:sigma-70 family RNA polymerase sigma factor [Bacillus sp. SD075]MBO0997079.1 sigma-70 family RNA polymerase sigma factor [Bacillus sp. SD075]
MEDFSALSKEFTPMIHHIIRSLSIYKNKEEYFQVGLIALWESYGKFDEEYGQFSNYAYTVIKGKILNELKLHHKYEIRNEPFDSFILDIKDPFSMHEETFAIDNILSYTEGLTLNQQRWLLQTYLENKTVSEIAEIYQVTIAAVKSWRRSALIKLRKQFIFPL